jgi:hypothetical protein
MILVNHHRFNLRVPAQFLHGHHIPIGCFLSCSD